MMSCEEIIAAIRQLADPESVAAWEKLNLHLKGTYLGANLTKLTALSKKIKKNHHLAIELWQTGIHDARLLSTMIEEPKKVTETQIDTQVVEIFTTDLIDKYCTNVIAKTNYLDEKMVQWSEVPDTQELLKRAAFILVVERAKHNTDAPDSDFILFLQQIRYEIQQTPNWAKEAMLQALIAIGRRNKTLNAAALEVLEEVEPIVVDYGDSALKPLNPRKALTDYRLKDKWEVAEILI
jgi:3-methyladenine DNA glycosylase AlkD